WFWAATSKLNRHFPSVILVMMNNGPFFPKWLKRRLFASYPDDLRSSRLAAAIAHRGTVLEHLIPVGLLLSSAEPGLSAPMLVVMACFPGSIAITNPTGMPVEWNLLTVYGGVFLFGVHPEASPLAIVAAPGLAAFLFLWLAVVPCYGNFVPARVS